MSKVFVYGTLRKGQGNHYLLEKSELLGNDEISGFVMFSYTDSYPMCIPGNSSTKITGEVYEVDKRTMDRLDWLEGYPHLYNRMEVETSHGDAWIYFMNTPPENAVVVSDGDWVKFHNAE